MVRHFALITALNAESVLQSVIFMFIFGTGTLPAMLTLSLFGFMISLKARNNMKSMIPYMVAVMAFLLILRGMNLGIPFISPIINHDPGTPVSCR